jgi:hypothetical protein
MRVSIPLRHRRWWYVTNGDPITYRRLDHLRVRIGRQLPWVATQRISTHWLRHSAVVFVVGFTCRWRF